jgi:hypothetical protein
MTEIEFREIAKVTNLSKVEGKVEGYNFIFSKENLSRDIYFINDFYIHYTSGQGNASIYGKELPSIIELYKKFFSKKDMDSNKKKILLFTKEDLLAFILLIKDYSICKDEIPLSEWLKYDGLIGSVNESVIALANPNISSEEWIMRLGQYDNYIKNREKWNNFVLGREFLTNIERFDKAVNFLSDENVDVLKVHDLMRKNKIIVKNVFSGSDDVDKNYCTMIMKSNDNKTCLKYDRGPEGYCTMISSGSGLYLLHRCSYLEGYNDEIEETIECNCFKKGNEDTVKFSFNKAMIKFVDIELYSNVYEQLIKAVEVSEELSSTILSNNKVKTLIK